MEYKDCRVEYEAKEQDGELTFEGLASTHIQGDSHDDQVMPGSFADTLERRFKQDNRIKILYQHQILEPIGIPTHLAEVSKGLEFVARLSKTTRGIETHQLMKDGVIDRMSFGFKTIEHGFITDEEKGRRIRQLHKLELYELSPVTFPSNEEAVISAVKRMEVTSHQAWNDHKCVVRDVSEFKPDTLELLLLEPGVKALVGVPYGMTDKRVQMVRFSKGLWVPRAADHWIADHMDDLALDLTKEAMPFRDLPLAGRETEWNADAAEKRVRDWAGAEAAPNTTYRRAFMRYDGKVCKLQVADVVEGKLVAVPRAVFAVAAALEDMPKAEADAVRSHVESYYAKMRKEWDDSSLVAPWNKSAPAESLTMLGSGLKRILSIAKGER